MKYIFIDRNGDLRRTVNVKREGTKVKPEVNQTNQENKEVQKEEAKTYSYVNQVLIEFSLIFIGRT